MTAPPGSPGSDPAAVLSALGQRGQTVAVAESLTGGLVCAALIDRPGASAVVRGGVVAYATELKHRLLDVDGRLLARAGPVDPGVVAEMALGVRERLGADWGLATTGVAGPDPQHGLPPGRVFVAVAGPLVGVGAGREAPAGPVGTRVLRLDLAGDRAAVRAATVHEALGLLLAVLREVAGTGRAPVEEVEHAEP